MNIGVRNIFCVLEKSEKKWWNKLLRGDEKAPHYVKVDWDKWVDEDDDNETGTTYLMFFLNLSSTIFICVARTLQKCHRPCRVLQNCTIFGG